MKFSKFLLFSLWFAVVTISVDDCVQSLDDFLAETKDYDEDNFDAYLALAMSTANVFGGLEFKFLVQVVPKILGLASRSAPEQAQTCLISLDNVIDEALINERGGDIASQVKVMEDRINEAVGVESEFTGKENGHLYENGHNDHDYCVTVWGALADISAAYSELIPADFLSNDISFNSVFVYQPLYAAATRLYKIILDFALGCPTTDARSTNENNTSNTHEDYVLNAYAAALEKMDQVLELMSPHNGMDRVNNISCNETCNSTGTSNGCKDSTCTCACFDDVVAGTYNSYSTRTYDIVCNDAGISDWRVSTEWGCTIRDQANNRKWYEVWKAKYKAQCWDNEDHAGECITDDYKKQQKEDMGYYTYRDQIEDAIGHYRDEIEEIVDVIKGNTLGLSQYVELNAVEGANGNAAIAYANFQQYFYVDDGCHRESNGKNDHDDDVIGFYALESETHAVRCCSTDGNSCISADTANGFQCENNKTYAQAVEYCANIPGNYRLCTGAELLTDICCGTGCGFDSVSVWTSTENNYRAFDWVIYYDIGMPNGRETTQYATGDQCASKCSEDDQCYGYLQKSQTSCAWTSHSNQYSGGYANGISTKFSLDEAKEQCILVPACHYVTCGVNANTCTLRGSTTLKTSPSGETSYKYACEGQDVCYRYTNNVVVHQSSSFNGVSPVLVSSFDTSQPTEWSVYMKQKPAVFTWQMAFEKSSVDYNLSCGDNRFSLSVHIGKDTSLDNYAYRVEQCKEMCYNHENGCIQFQVGWFELRMVYWTSCDMVFLSDLDSRVGSQAGKVLEPAVDTCGFGGNGNYIRKGCENCSSSSCASCELMLDY